MKHILTLCLCLLFALPLWADQMYLGYCEGQVSDNTQQISGTNKSIHCAILVPAANVASLAGNRITTLRVGVNTACSKLPANVTAWIRTSANGDNLAEKTATVTTGWNDIVLDAPFVIPEGQDLWIGYSYKQTTTKLKVVSFAGPLVEGCSFWYNNGAMSGWNDYSLKAAGALSLEAVVEGDNLPQHDLLLKDCSLNRHSYKIGSPLTISARLRNNALLPADGFDVAYSFNGDASTAGVVSFDQQLQYREECDFSFNLPTDALPEGANTLSLEVRWRGGIADDYAADNVGELSFTAFSQGFQRTVMLEEFTTEQCGWCPLGISYINQALDDNGLRGSVVWVCHHAGFGTDFLTVSASQTYTALYGTGGTFAPAMMVDRTLNATYCQQGVVGGATMDPVYTADWLGASVDEPAFVSVEILSATCIGNDIKVRVRAEKYDAFDSQASSPRINVWVTENHIPMRSQTDNSGLKTGYHEHALRRVLTATWGTNITWDGNAYEAEFTCQKGSDWEVENLQAVAFISNYSASSIYQRQIYNAAERHIADTEQGISHLTVDAPSAEVSYSIDGRITRGNVPGITLRRTVAADGTVRVEKVISGY